MDTVAPQLLGAASEALGLAWKTVGKLLDATALAALAAAHPDPTAPGARTAYRDAARSSLEARLAAAGHRQAEVARALGLSRTTLGKVLEVLGLARAATLDEAALRAALDAAGGDAPAAAQALGVSVEALRLRLGVANRLTPPAGAAAGPRRPSSR